MKTQRTQAAFTVPTSTNIFCMMSVLAENAGKVPARVANVDAPHIKRCILGGLLEAVGTSHFILTTKGHEAMAKYKEDGGTVRLPRGCHVIDVKG